MRIIIDVSQETADEIKKVMKLTEYPSDEVADFCFYLIRVALKQLSDLDKMGGTHQPRKDNDETR